LNVFAIAQSGFNLHAVDAESLAPLRKPSPLMMGGVFRLIARDRDALRADRTGARRAGGDARTAMTARSAFGGSPENICSP
jgi:hypothetical protein